jgi:hypothetical protein
VDQILVVSISAAPDPVPRTRTASSGADTEKVCLTAGAPAGAFNPGDLLWNLFIGLVPIFLIVSVAYSLRGMLLPRGGDSSSVVATSTLDLVYQNWVLFQNEFDLSEVWIGFIAWSSTNLFIRRLLNPEIGVTAFEKYGGDSIFGGFSAAFTVLLKALLKKSLRDMQNAGP